MVLFRGFVIGSIQIIQGGKCLRPLTNNSCIRNTWEGRKADSLNTGLSSTCLAQFTGAIHAGHIVGSASHKTETQRPWVGYFAAKSRVFLLDKQCLSLSHTPAGLNGNGGGDTLCKTNLTRHPALGTHTRTNCPLKNAALLPNGLCLSSLLGGC